MIKKIIYALLIVVGVFGILNAIFIAYISTGITHGTVFTALIGISLIIFGILKLIFKNRNIIQSKVVRMIFLVCFISFVAVFIIIETCIISSYGFNDKKDTDAEVVIVLGCGIFKDGTPTLTLQKRMNVAYEYLKNSEDAVCIVSGGKGPNEPYSEARAMKKYMLEKGFDENRIIMEDKSTSTSENLIYSNKIIDDLGIDGKIGIATSEFHMFRTKFLAKRYGMEQIICLPTDTSWYLWVNVHLREFLAVIKSFFLD